MAEYVLEIYGSPEVLEKLRTAIDDYLVDQNDGQAVLEALQDIDGMALEEIKEDGEQVH